MQHCTRCTVARLNHAAMMYKIFISSTPTSTQRLLSTTISGISVDKRLCLREKFRGLGEGDINVDKIKYHGHDIAVISLSNYKNRNAMSGKMMSELADTVDSLEQWYEGKAVVLRGVNGMFCSGADLTVARAILSHEGGEMMSCLMHDTLVRLRRLPLISIAAVEGQALGGGAELMLSCDFRMIKSNAEIQFVQATMGVTPGWAGGTHLVDLVGRQQALKILTSSMKIDATKAKAICLVDGIVDKKLDIVENTCEWLLPYLRAPASVIQAMKKVVVAGNSGNIEKSLETERAIFKTMWSGKENLEALNKALKHK